MKVCINTTFIKLHSSQTRPQDSPPFIVSSKILRELSATLAKERDNLVAIMFNGDSYTRFRLESLAQPPGNSSSPKAKSGVNKEFPQILKVDNQPYHQPAPLCINLNFPGPVNTQYQPYNGIKARSEHKG